MRWIVRGHTSTAEATQGRIGERASGSWPNRFPWFWEDRRTLPLPPTNLNPLYVNVRKKTQLNLPHFLGSFESFVPFRSTVSFASTVNTSSALLSGHDGRVGSFTTRFSSGARPFRKAIEIGRVLGFPVTNSMVVSW